MNHVAKTLPARGKAVAGERRDGTATRQRLLQVALSEFAEHGHSGGRIDRIARNADVNVRMIYHYFGNKDDLYVAALEASYRTIREQERALDLSGSAPAAAMRRLIDLTFDFLATDPYFVRLIMSENLIMGKLVAKSDTISQMTRPLLDSLDEILKRGQTDGIFHNRIESEHLYISILSLCFTHVSNRYTLAAMFKRDFADPRWLTERKAIVSEIIITYLTSDRPSAAELLRTRSRSENSS